MSTSFAQISITSEDVPGAGDIIIQSHDMDPVPAIQPGDAGANVTWDLSALEGESEDSIYFMHPANTPYANEFPSANLAMNATDTGYIYLDKNQDQMSWIGMAMDFDTIGTITVDIEPEYVVAEFPLQYGDELTSSYYWMFTMSTEQPGLDSIRIKMSTERMYTVDGWGQVTLPMGTFDALRFHQTGTTIDSLWIKTPVGWMFSNSFSFDSESYYWWSDNSNAGYVVATLEMDESGNVSSVTYMKSEMIQPVEEYQQERQVARIYPNPVENFMNIEFTRDFSGRFMLMDLTGQTVSSRIVGGKAARIDLSGHTPGLYVYEIRNREDSNVQTGKIMKQ